jgi:Family of unknown function (DUF5681)
MPEEDAAYKIGYGKPPQNGRFTKGVSGNPKGRPKGSKNLSTVVLRESRQRVRVNGPRGSHTVTKLEAALMQLGNKAAQGDLRASREFFSLIQRSEDTADSRGSSDEFSELDQPVIANLRRRIAIVQNQAGTAEEETGK